VVSAATAPQEGGRTSCVDPFVTVAGSFPDCPCPALETFAPAHCNSTARLWV